VNILTRRSASSWRIPRSRSEGHSLGAVGEQVQVDIGVLRRGTREHRAHQPRLEFLEQLHRDQRRPPLLLE
jgi:hypothetical protein